jgi:hypothetical protein
MLKDESKWALTKGAEKAGIISPEFSEQIRQNTIGTDPLTSGAIQRHVEGLAKSYGKDVSPTQTVPGQYAETAASFLPMAAAIPFMGGASAGEALSQVPGALLKYGAIPAATSETAGQLTQGTDAEPYARALGAFAGTNPMATLKAIATGAGKAASAVAPETSAAIKQAINPISGAVESMTPEQAQTAQELLDRSRQANAPLTVPESVQRATGSGTKLGDIQRVVEQSPQGAAVMRPFMAERPAQTEALGKSMTDQIYPFESDPYQIAPRVQGAAQHIIDTSPQAEHLSRAVESLGPNTTAEEAGNVIRPELQQIYDRREGMRNALAGQDYGAAREADYTTNGAAANPVRVNPVIDYVDDLLSSAKGGVATALREARSTLLTNGQPDMSVTGLSNARKAISDQISSAARAGNNQVSRVLLDVQGQLDYALERVPEYGQARRNFAAASEPLAPFAENTAPGKIIDRDQYNQNYTMPTENVAPTIEKGGPSAADQFLAAAENSPRARQAFGQYYSRQILGSATNPSGIINPTILANTLRQNSDMLQRFPEIVTNLNRVGVARKALQVLEQTPLGALAQTTGITGQEQFAAQRNLLFNPTASLAGGERTLGNTVSAIAEHDPEAARQFVSQHIQQAFNEATQSNLSGPNQFGGPKFAAVLAGNTQQAKNLEAAVRALPDGNTRWAAIRKGMDILEAMGTRQPVGSQTAYNAQMNKWLEQGNPAHEFMTSAASPGRWPSLVHDIYHRVMFNKNTGELARIFTEGNVSDLRDIAGAGSRSFQGQAAMVGAMARQGALSTPEQQQGQP